MKKPILNLDIINKIKRNSYFDKPKAPCYFYVASVLRIIKDNPYKNKRGIDLLSELANVTINNCLEVLEERGFISSKMIKGRFHLTECYYISEDEEAIKEIELFLENAPKKAPVPKRDTVAKKIVKILKTNKLTRRALSEDLGEDMPTVDGAIYKLVERGLIMKVAKKRGATRYELT